MLAYPPLPTQFDPNYVPGPSKRGSTALKILCWVVLAVLTGFTVLTALGLAIDHDRQYVKRDVVVTSTDEPILCELTVTTGRRAGRGRRHVARARGRTQGG